MAQRCLPVLPCSPPIFLAELRKLSHGDWDEMPGAQLRFPTGSPMLHQAKLPVLLSSLQAFSQPRVPAESKTQRAGRSTCKFLCSISFPFFFPFLLLSETLYWHIAFASFCISSELQPAMRFGFAEKQMTPPKSHWVPESVHPHPVCCILAFPFYSGLHFVPLFGISIASHGILNSSSTCGRDFKNRWDEWVWEAEREMGRNQPKIQHVAGN